MFAPDISKHAEPAAQGVEPVWARMIPDEQWATYVRAMSAFRAAGVPFLLGGGFAMATYTQCWRNTKDIDFYLMPEQRQSAVETLTRAGFSDYFSKLPYDRGWIYRGTSNDVIVDLIWSMANRRATVDALWFERGHPLLIRGEMLKIIPVEELIWSKLFVLQHDHCDWPDLLNVLYAQAENINWAHLLERVEGDRLLLRALTSIFEWLCPQRFVAIPETVRNELAHSPEPSDTQSKFDRVRLLDSRRWYVGRLGPDEQLEI